MRDRKNDKPAIDAELQKTLHSLDHIVKMKARPFFYTRLQRRLDTLHKREPASILSAVYGKFLRPALVPLLIVASIVSGILVGYKSETDNRAASINSMIEAYGLSAPALSNYTLTMASE